MARLQHRKILSIVLTDRTFERAEHRGREVWAGRCIHCNAHLLVSLEGEPIGDATVEHIVPRTHGGTDDLKNLALACARCNHQKGRRHDLKRRGDEKLEAMITRLRARREERWRDPEP